MDIWPFWNTQIIWYYFFLQDGIIFYTIYCRIILYLILYLFFLAEGNYLYFSSKCNFCDKKSNFFTPNMSSYLLDITLIDIQDNLMRGYITKKDNSGRSKTNKSALWESDIFILILTYLIC